MEEVGGMAGICGPLFQKASSSPFSKQTIQNTQEIHTIQTQAQSCDEMKSVNYNSTSMCFWLST